MNLIVGSTGYLGGEIARRLLERGEPVRCLVRPTSSPQATQALAALGAELVMGDLKDPPSIRAACEGASRVFTTATTTRERQQGDSIATVERDGHLGLVDAARGAGVAHFIYVSFTGGIDREARAPLTQAKRAVEERLRRSGMTYTILRPGVFMEVWLSPVLGFDPLNGRAVVYGDGTHPISFISLGDVAAFALESTTNPAARNAVLELGGPEAIAPNDVVRLFEDMTGRPIEVQHVPEAALEAQYAEATEALAQSFAILMLSIAKGNVIDMRETLRRFPVPMTSVQDYARQAIAVAQPAQ
jgi:uncharacterized protein YbjT (DUF2867 family)